MPKRKAAIRVALVFAVLLAVILMTLSATFFPATNKFDQKTQDIDFSGIDLSAVGNATISDEGVFRKIELKQEKVSVLLITGEVDTEALKNVIAGDISVRIGEDKIFSDIKNIEVAGDGTFSFEFRLNSLFCSQYGNVVPVVFGYTEKDESGILCIREYKTTIGVITYDFETGILFAPDGTVYKDSSGNEKLLGKNSVPDDCFRDSEGNVTLKYGGNLLTFRPNGQEIGETPALGSGHGILAQTSDSITINASVGLEYGVIGLTGSIDESYGNNIDWKIADEINFVIGDLRDDIQYTLWVRTPGNGETPAGAPIYMGTVTPAKEPETEQERQLAAVKEETVEKIKEMTDGVLFDAETANDYIVRVNKVKFEPDETVSDLNEYTESLIKQVELIYRAAECERNFNEVKTENKEKIEALKAGNSIPADSAEAYLSSIEEVTFNYDEITGSPDDYTAKLNEAIKRVVAEAESERDFEIRKAEKSEELKNAVSEKTETGKYTASQIGEMDSLLSETLNLISELRFSDPDKDSKLNEAVTSALNELDAIKIYSISNGELPHIGNFGDYDYPASFNSSAGLWGNVRSETGMSSTLSLTITFKLRDGETDAGIEKIPAGGLSAEELAGTVEDKLFVFGFTVGLADENGTAYTVENGQKFTVRILIPEEYRTLSGVQIISENEGAVSVYKTEKDGNYLVFDTDRLGEFSVISDKTVNLTWALIVLGVLLIIEVVVIVRFSLKLKKNKTLCSFFPFLAVVFTPQGVIPAIVVFGGLAVAGGVASTVLAVKSKKASSSENAENDISDETTSADQEKQQEPFAQKAGEMPQEYSESEELTAETVEEEPEETAESEEVEAVTAEENPDSEVKSEEAAETVEEEPEETAESEEVEAATAEENPDSEVKSEEVAETADKEPEKEVETEEVQTDDSDIKAEDSLTQNDYQHFSVADDDQKAEENAETVELEQVEAVAYSEAVKNAEIEDVEESDRKSEDDDIEPSEWDDEEGFSAYDREELAEKPDIRPVAVIATAAVAEETAAGEDERDDSDEDTEEDKKVFSLGNGNRVYVTYDYSFESKLIMSGEDVQRRHALISDVLMSYGLKKRESWKKERYYLRGTSYAQMIFRGKTLCVCLAIAPESLEGSKYYFDDVSKVKKYENVPVLLRVRSARGCKYAVELIDMMMESAGIDKKREVSDKFVLRPVEDKMQLIERGLIKVMMTDGEGEVVAADFEAMKAQKFNLAAGLPLLKKVSAEQVTEVSDSEAAGFIESEDETENVLGRRKGIINIDTISEAYSEGETVTLRSLIAKQLVPKNVNFIKVLARGVLDKPLTVKAHDFSLDAVKMIVMVGGSAVKLKSKQ